MRGKLTEKGGDSEVMERNGEFLKEREEDARRYYRKFGGLREKVREFVRTVGGEGADRLLKEMEVTDTERSLYLSRLETVLPT